MGDDSKMKRSPKGVFRDYFAACECASWQTFLGFPILLLLVSVLFGLLPTCGSGPKRTVTLYTSQDQNFAEPILHRFTKRHGIRVQTVFDSEAVKTVGLANRLLAETNHPQCDVWWSNEALRTRQLAARGVFRDTNSVATFGFRSRRLVVNTNLLALAQAPATLLELTNARWRGKVALAYPMFGTTSAHFLALRQHWGEAGWLAWCRALAANKPFLVDGNSVVVKLVGRGEAAIGLTDSDDILAGEVQRLPIAGGPITGESLLIPNSVAIVRGAPHGAEAEELFHYLRSDEVINDLIEAGALEGAQPGVRPRLNTDWDGVLADLDRANAQLKEIFLR